MPKEHLDMTNQDKDYHSQFISDMCVFVCTVSCAELFLLNLFTNDSVFLSLILSIFSCTTTLSFEIVEWLKLSSKFISSSFGKYILNNSNSALLLSCILFIISTGLFSIWSKLHPESYQNYIQAINPHIPNIIAALAFITYFISYFVRNFHIRRKEFIKSSSKRQQ